MLLVVAPSTFGALVPIQEPIIGFIHPTAYTLRAGEWIVGHRSLFVGITDEIMIGTDPYRNLSFLNLSGRVSLGYIPELRADLAVNWSVRRTGPRLAALRVPLYTVFGAGGIASVQATDELTLHTGFGIGVVRDDRARPLHFFPRAVFLWADYKLSPGKRLLGSFDTCLDLINIRIGAGIMARWEWLWGPTLLLGGIVDFDLDPRFREEPIFFHPIVQLFWRF